MTGKNELPFQSWRNVFHHVRSALDPALRRMKWCGALSRERSENSCRRNIRPCGMTVVAWDKWPKSDSNCRLVHVRRCIHCCIASWSLWNLSAGRRSSKVSVSIRIPRNIRTVVGPSVLLTATGIPSLANVCRAIARNS